MRPKGAARREYWMEVLLLVLGALVGVFVDRGYEFARSRTSEYSRKAAWKRREKAKKPSLVSKTLQEYYGKKELYLATISGTSKTIPLFVQKDWIFFEDLHDLPQRLAVEKPVENDEFIIDENLIELRRNQGQRLFNNFTYYTKSTGSGPNEDQFLIAPTEYYKVITNLIQLEEEVFSSTSLDKAQLPFRDATFSSKSEALSAKLKPLSFGVNVGFVLKSTEEANVILQKRSTQTVTYGSSMALFPLFGLAPFGGGASADPSELVYTNFVKEYLEEFFDNDDLIDNLSLNRVDPLWFMKLPEAIKIGEARKKGELKIFTLGFCLDALSGTTTLSILVELSNDQLQKEILESIVGNWEVEKPTIEAPSIEIIDLFSSELGRYLQEDLLHSGSAFTLERMQDHYREQRVDA